ncbi:MAG: hypothetical protein IJG67_02105 [Oscillospiraceae bacterium]|nr:hypothetical protein [Oscillospiraceae bacterium]
MARLIVRKKEKGGKNRAALRTAVAVASGLAFAAVSVACIAALYAKSLTDVRYLEEDDEYTED